MGRKHDTIALATLLVVTNNYCTGTALSLDDDLYIKVKKGKTLQQQYKPLVRIGMCVQEWRRNEQSVLQELCTNSVSRMEKLSLVVV